METHQVHYFLALCGILDAHCSRISDESFVMWKAPGGRQRA
jgi:hypothetical protein